jgi:uncharacterized protein (DUF433 family)
MKSDVIVKSHSPSPWKSGKGPKLHSGMSGIVLVEGKNISVERIVRRPNVMGGSPTIAGTRVRVSDVVRMHRRTRSHAAVKRALPHLTVAQIEAALAYYKDKTARRLIDDEIKSERDMAAKWRPAST